MTGWPGFRLLPPPVCPTAAWARDVVPDHQHVWLQQWCQWHDDDSAASVHVPPVFLTRLRLMPDQQLQMRVPSLAEWTSALDSFISSSSTFRVLHGLIPPGAARAQARSRYVLDSSFNPPTRAHLRIATSAIQHDRGSSPKRLLLLLAIQNADKGSTRLLGAFPSVG